jgi:hypothetical protein
MAIIKSQEDDVKNIQVLNHHPHPLPFLLFSLFFLRTFMHIYSFNYSLISGSSSEKNAYYGVFLPGACSSFVNAVKRAGMMSLLLFWFFIVYLLDIFSSKLYLTRIEHERKTFFGDIDLGVNSVGIP